MTTKKNGKVELAVMANDIKHIRGEVTEIKKKLDEDYVTKQEFNSRLSPMEKIMYGIIGVVGLAVLGAVINQVIKP